MFAVAFAIAVIRPGWRLPALAVAIVITATRVAINAHYLSDVAGGLLVALATVWWIERTFDRRGWPFRENRDQPETGDQKPSTAP
jgi:membrane-associated phospholipid phosphatase